MYLSYSSTCPVLAVGRGGCPHIFGLLLTPQKSHYLCQVCSASVLQASLLPAKRMLTAIGVSEAAEQIAKAFKANPTQLASLSALSAIAQTQWFVDTPGYLGGCIILAEVAKFLGPIMDANKTPRLVVIQTILKKTDLCLLGVLTGSAEKMKQMEGSVRDHCQLDRFRLDAVVLQRVWQRKRRYDSQKRYMANYNGPKQTEEEEALLALLDGDPDEDTPLFEAPTPDAKTPQPVGTWVGPEVVDGENATPPKEVNQNGKSGMGAGRGMKCESATTSSCLEPMEGSHLMSALRGASSSDQPMVSAEEVWTNFELLGKATNDEVDDDSDDAYSYSAYSYSTCSTGDSDDAYSYSTYSYSDDEVEDDHLPVPAQPAPATSMVPAALAQPAEPATSMVPAAPANVMELLLHVPAVPASVLELAKSIAPVDVSGQLKKRAEAESSDSEEDEPPVKAKRPKVEKSGQPKKPPPAETDYIKFVKERLKDPTFHPTLGKKRLAMAAKAWREDHRPARVEGNGCSKCRWGPSGCAWCNPKKIARRLADAAAKPKAEAAPKSKAKAAPKSKAAREKEPTPAPIGDSK